MTNSINTGGRNFGYWNSGDYNAGDSNSGYMNDGDFNTGDYNLGCFNTGDKNEGSYNTGSFNTGSNNSGDFNICNDSSGVFCTEPQTILFFNKPSPLTYTEWRQSEAFDILKRIRTSAWVKAEFMTLIEKRYNKSYRINGGYLHTNTIRYGANELWHFLSEREKAVILNMPNFDAETFKMVTGIDVGK